MKIEEVKEVKKVTIESVIVGRECDICGNVIEIVKRAGNIPQYNYFVIHTWHHDWGNDSIDSHKYYDACCPECVMNFTKKYVQDSYDNMFNSHSIEIEHVRSLQEGAIE